MKRMLVLAWALISSSITPSFADQDLTVRGCGIAAVSADQTDYILETSEGEVEILFPSSLDPSKVNEDGLYDSFVHALGKTVCLEGSFVDSRRIPGNKAVLIRDIQIQN
jgi:hypothetical protein